MDEMDGIQTGHTPRCHAAVARLKEKAGGYIYRSDGKRKCNFKSKCVTKSNFVTSMNRAAPEKDHLCLHA